MPEPEFLCALDRTREPWTFHYIAKPSGFYYLALCGLEPKGLGGWTNMNHADAETVARNAGGSQWCESCHEAASDRLAAARESAGGEVFLVKERGRPAESPIYMQARAGAKATWTMDSDQAKRFTLEEANRTAWLHGADVAPCARERSE